ncbi:MAG: hypothetical protein BGO39_20755 [Chloroflexi bacterium 54-19]|nr:MAG: hypothetical protein BGO39_20755 [Chloroflexi bacterium 54-19]
MQWGSVVIGLLTLVATAYFATAGAATLGNNYQLVVLAGISIGLGSFLTAAGILAAGAKTRREVKRYRGYLGQQRNQLALEKAEYCRILNWIDPPPAELLDVVAEGKGRYLWERQPNHVPAFLRVRIGIQPVQPGGVRIKLPSSVTSNLNPTDLDKEIQKLYKDFSSVENVPGLVNLREAGVFGVAGSFQFSYELVCAIVCQIAVHHSPEDVRMMFFYSQERAPEWFWAGWLPHSQPIDGDEEKPWLAGTGSDMAKLASNLKQILEQRREKAKNNNLYNNTNPYLPFIVVVIDDTGFSAIDRDLVRWLLQDGPAFNIITIYLARSDTALPAACLAFVNLQTDGNMQFVVNTREGTGLKSVLKADRISRSEQESLARKLAPLQLIQGQKAFSLQQNLNFFEVLGWNKLDGRTVAQNWQSRGGADLEALLGQDSTGREMLINLDESGHGTHGILAGESGSGKGELLLTLITSLALKNHPSRLNFVLADFKGGATFSVFEQLPHTVGFATDQIDEFGLTRFLTAIQVELQRRKDIMETAKKRYGHRVQKIRDYELAAPDEVFPFLLIVIDEFAELARTVPDMLDKLIPIAQQGRSLGVFLLLSMQSTEALKGQIELNLSYRIALRMSKDDSMKLLKDAAAASISRNNRGRAFFRWDNLLQEFQTARVMTQVLSMRDLDKRDTQEKPQVRLIDINWTPVKPPQISGGINTSGLAIHNPPTDIPIDVEIAVKACQDAVHLIPLHKPLSRPWLPPLPIAIALSDLMPGVLQGNHFQGWPDAKEWVRLPVGVQDRYWDWQNPQPVLYADLSAGRHLQFLGTQDSGRTSALLSSILGLAVTHTPNEVAFVFIDFGTTLSLFKNLPHRVEHFGSHQCKEIADILNDLVGLLEDRRQRFANLENDRIATNLPDYRAYQQNRGLPVEKQAEAVVVVIDNYTSWYQSQPDFHFQVLPLVKNLVQNGPAFGIHLIITADRAMDVASAQLQANFLSISLRMDPTDLGVMPYDRKILAAWQGRNGRGFIENSGNYNLVEVQCLNPTAVSEAEQLKTVQYLVNEIAACQKVTS